MVTRRLAAASATAALLLAATTAFSAATKRELTPADAVATVRVMENQLPGSQQTNGNVSPDGHRYLLRLAHGDVERNGVWMDLLTGTLDSLDSASHPRLCAHLFTTGLGSTESLRSADADPEPSNEIRWVNSSQIAFLWSDERSVRQVMSVDLTTCKRRWLTHGAANVYSFAIAPDGTLLFDAQVPEAKGRSAQLWESGFALNDSADGWSILEGRVDGTSYLASLFNTWFIRSASSLRSVNVYDKLVDISNPHFRDVSASPDGSYAIIAVGAASPPTGWNQYSSSSLQKSLLLSQTARTLQPVRFALIDMHRATSRMLWNAPFNARGRVQWSPRGNRLLLAPTFLPPDAPDPMGLTGNAAADLDISTGAYRVLPLDLTGRIVVNSRWMNSSSVKILSTTELAADPHTDCFTLIDDHWQRVPCDAAVEPRASPSSIHLETRQSLNSPPQIFAIDANSGAERLLIDTNPHLLDTFKLGRVERLSGTLPNGKQWLGQLMYPADYQPGKKYPLVIQGMYSRTFGPEEFSLEDSWGMSGMGLGPGDLAAYAGQLLATRNVAVLQLDLPYRSPGVEEAEDHQLAFETLAEMLSSSGLADRNEIALDGFSNNGFWVEYTLSHSTFPFAAAIAADNYDPSYFQSALSNWRELDVATNGATAFGAGLQEWFKRAPGFNAEHIHSPLRMIGQSGGIQLLMAKWEIYSRLRALNKPVEFYMMPEANTHPSHLPQNPRQIMAIQDGVIDWFSFWLTGREDPSPQKRDQYARWRAFRAVQNAADLQGAKDR
jgi:hypothetical protein